jgi:hypothetical protein
LWYFQTLPHILRFNDLNVPVAGNLVVFSNSAKYWVRGLQSCGIFKHCLFGGFNSSNFPRCWQSCGTFKKRKYWMASTTEIFPRGLQSCGILKHCHIFGVFNNLIVPRC